MAAENRSESWASEQEFHLHVEKELQRLRELTSSTNWVNTPAWDEVLRTVHNLRGTAAMVGHPIIARIFEGLEKKLEHPGDYADVQLRAEVGAALLRATDSLRGPSPSAPAPAVSAPAPAMNAPKPISLSPATLARLKPLHILVVDDDPVFRLGLRASYQPLGMRMTEMSSGAELAPDCVEKEKVDALILDLQLPGEDGYSICKRLKASPKSCHVPIIFSSATGELESRLFGWQAGGEDFIVKPVDPMELLLRVQLLVEKATSRRKQQLDVGMDYQVFLKELGGEIQKASAGKERLVLAMLSLSGGGATGNQRAEGAKFLVGRMRRGDLLCSPAAGYLMVLLHQVTLKSSQKIYQTLARNLKQHFALDCRVGLAEFPTHGKSAQDLLAATKECLDQALRDGKESSVITPHSQRDEEPPPPKILVVDDDEVFLDHLGKHLADLGYNAVLVSTSQRAVEFVRAHKPDLVTLDLLMPDPSGLKILEMLKADPDLATIPVIVVSAKEEEESLVKAFTLGAADYLIKPFRSAELNARVRKVLRENAAAD